MITWNAFFININLKGLLKKELVLKASQTQILQIYFKKNNLFSFQNTKLSEFHKLVLILLKTIIVKNEPPEIQYRNYKYFHSSKFNRDLKDEFSREYLDSCSKFNKIFLKV